MFTLRRLLMLATVALLGLAIGTTAAHASPKNPRKARWEVTFSGYWGVDWYVRMSDGEVHDNCVAGVSADGESDFEAWTRGHRKQRVKLFTTPGRSAYGSLPIETALTRKLTMGQPAKDCEREHAAASAKLDCQDGVAQWGRFGNPPAFLDIAAGRGGVAVEVRRNEQDRLPSQIWDFCPFWGHYEGQIEGEAKLSTRKLFSGKAQTVKGYARQDYPGGDGQHEQEGYREWKLKIRYLKPGRR